MDVYVAHEVKLQEEETTQAINTPHVMTRHTGKEQYCNVNRNNELVISIIFKHINMTVFRCCR